MGPSRKLYEKNKSLECIEMNAKSLTWLVGKVQAAQGSEDSNPNEIVE